MRLAASRRAKVGFAVVEEDVLVVRMNTQEVANKVVELTRKQAWREAIENLYAKDIVSVEAHAGPSGSFESRGIDAVRGKTDWWEKNVEVHSCKVSDPFVAHDRFVVQYDIDFTEKNSKERTTNVGGRCLYGEGWQDRARGISAADGRREVIAQFVSAAEGG